MDNNEIALQESFAWERKTHFNNYNQILGYYQAVSVLENFGSWGGGGGGNE